MNINIKMKMPTEIIGDENCVKKNTERFAELGKKAIIVTGKHSAKSCGALDDVVSVCEEQSISYHIFSEIENNPSFETVVRGGEIAKEFQADFVIGIGGGSPLDASKAISVLAANDMDAMDLFKNQFTKALPIIAIPTTAGTGSEATPYSVILRKDMQTKVSFGNTCTFPRLALLDAKYTTSLSKSTTIHTAVDAFTHVFEGYLCNRSSAISDALAVDAIRIFGECLDALVYDKVDEEIRNKLMYVSVIGGIVISHTGVTIAHGMGYCYTYFYEIPHGMANGLLMKTYLNHMYELRKEKINHSMKLLKCSNVKEFTDKLEILLGIPPVLTKEQIDEFTELTSIQKGSMSNTPGIIDKEEIHTLWENTMK